VKKLFFIFIALLFVSTVVYGQQPRIDTRAKFKSIFIYNFTKYVEWPEAYREGDFVIGVVGGSSLYGMLKSSSKDKKVNNQTVVVKKFASIDEVDKCHILYISEDFKDVAGAVAKIKEHNTLVVTEGPGLVDNYSAINFVVVANALKFELNKGNIKKYNLTMSNSLERLATKVVN